jgi:hypothetical protein
MMRRNAGVILEPLIWLGCFAVGGWLVVPRALILFRGGSLGGWQWTCLLGGSLLILHPLFLIGTDLVSGLRKKRLGDPS